jgi:hypothetical protein
VVFALMFALATVKAQANTKNAIIFFITDSVLCVINKRHMYPKRRCVNAAWTILLFQNSNKRAIEKPLQPVPWHRLILAYGTLNQIVFNGREIYMRESVISLQWIWYMVLSVMVG